MQHNVSVQGVLVGPITLVQDEDGTVVCTALLEETCESPAGTWVQPWGLVIPMTVVLAQPVNLHEGAEIKVTESTIEFIMEAIGEVAVTLRVVSMTYLFTAQ